MPDAPEDNVVNFPTSQDRGFGSILPRPVSGMVGQGIGGDSTSAAVRVEYENPATPEDDLAVEVGDDGAVLITAPAVHSHRNDEYDDFGANLAERVPDNVLMSLADDTIQGVDADIASRASIIEQHKLGLELLGTKIEQVTAARGSKTGISRVGHPLMIEAMVKYHAGAIGELLPAAGPAKVATFGQATPEEETRAQDFADDLNYFLTQVADEYYPDTSRMLMQQGYCGTGIKKIFRCGLRNRPVSESVSLIDFIVSEEASNLQDAVRVTHQSFPTRAQVRRMQLLGRYRDDIRLGTPSSGLPAANQAVKTAEGLMPMSTRPQDQPFNFLEVDEDIDFDFFPIEGKFERQAPDGLPLPYKVTIDRDSRRVFGLWRNWDPDDQLYRKDNMYVRYGLVPALGFHHWGFLQLLGNQTLALRAIWRILIDAGLFSNFPGGVKIKGARTSTNEISPSPGEFVDIDVPGATDIRQVLMALPYKQADAVFIQFAQMVQESAERLGGSVTLETGEGRTNVPVGTIMSQIEQNTQVMAAVHKSNHLAQKHELMKLRKLFAKNPKDLWAVNPDPKRRWDTADEFMDLNLIPASDPNIPSQVSRIMQAWALLMIVQQVPEQFDVQEVLRRALNAIRIGSPETLLLSPDQLAGASQPRPDPKLLAAQLQAQQKQAQTEAQGKQKMQEIALDAEQSQREHQVKGQEFALESADRAADRASRERVAGMREETERYKVQADLAKAAQAPPEAGTAMNQL